jgi:predicted MPP superfamily phosphohydrolase
MGIFLYVLLCTLALHAASGLMSLSGPGRQVIAAAGPSSGLWGLALVLAVSGAIAGFAFREARREILPTELEVTFKNLPPRLDGFTIVQVSDIHLGVIVGKAQLRRMVDQVNSLHPDLIVLTGDLVDEDAGYLNSLAHELSKLQAKYGVLACTGNHEFYAGIEKVMRQVAPTGVRYLRNEKVTIADALDVYGVDDPTAWQMNHGEPLWPRDVIGQEAKQRPSLLLYHQPLHYDDAARRGIDLVLSGHTHHGQLWPLGYISKLVYRYTTGFFSIGATRAYVSRGFGTWGPPMRFGSPPEIVRVRVRAASR